MEVTLTLTQTLTPTLTITVTPTLTLAVSPALTLVQIATDVASEEAAAAMGIQPQWLNHEEDGGTCRSIVGIEKGIDDEWCKTSCLQG